jgi:hypothetical protein
MFLPMFPPEPMERASNRVAVLCGIGSRRDRGLQIDPAQCRAPAVQ